MSKPMATVYKTIGEIKEIEPKGEHFTLEELQSAVGGYIELVPQSYPMAFCNEDGASKKLPLNFGASARFGGRLLGDVVQLNQVAHDQESAE